MERSVLYLPVFSHLLAETLPEGTVKLVVLYVHIMAKPHDTEWFTVTYDFTTRTVISD